MVAGKASGRIFIENGRFHGQVAIEQIATGNRRNWRNRAMVIQVLNRQNQNYQT